MTQGQRYLSVVFMVGHLYYEQRFIFCSFIDLLGENETQHEKNETITCSKSNNYASEMPPWRSCGVYIVGHGYAPARFIAISSVSANGKISLFLPLISIFISNRLKGIISFFHSGLSDIFQV